MIKTEITDKGLVHTWTDDRDMILRQTDTGLRYGTEVYDVSPCPHTYAESPLTKEEREARDREDAEIDRVKARAYDIMTGRAE